MHNCLIGRDDMYNTILLCYRVFRCHETQFAHIKNKKSMFSSKCFDHRDIVAYLRLLNMWEIQPIWSRSVICPTFTKASMHSEIQCSHWIMYSASKKKKPRYNVHVIVWNHLIKSPPPMSNDPKCCTIENIASIGIHNRTVIYFTTFDELRDILKLNVRAMTHGGWVAFSQ